MAAPPKVTVLEGLNNFDDWVDTLKANLAYHGIDLFIHDYDKLCPGDAGFTEWDKKRQMAKAIIKCSTIRVAADLLDAGWNVKSKNPKEHFDIAAQVMAARAEESGLVSTMIQGLCHIDRANFPTLAGYQAKLQSLNRSLTNLGYALDERFVRRTIRP